jgi:hypothetical protein
LQETGGVKFDALRVKFSRTWVDSSGKFRKNQLALPMLAMKPGK